MDLLNDSIDETPSETESMLEVRKTEFAAKAEAMANKYNTTSDEIIYLYVNKMETKIKDYQKRHDLIDLIITSPLAEDLYWDIVETTLLATKDTLTGLDNRRSMQSQLDKLAINYTRKQLPFSFIFMNLDNFNAINNKFGYSVGNEVLKAVSCVLMRHVRATDLACRMDVEEMAVIVDGDIAAATILAERIRIGIENIDVETLGLDKTQRKNITASIGVAEYAYVSGDNNTQSIQTLTQSAEVAQRKSRKNGQNQVTVA